MAKKDRLFYIAIFTTMRAINSIFSLLRLAEARDSVPLRIYLGSGYRNSVENAYEIVSMQFKIFTVNPL